MAREQDARPGPLAVTVIAVIWVLLLVGFWTPWAWLAALAAWGLGSAFLYIRRTRRQDGA